ncbi:hypothetical protein L208DRAFT_1384902 [Tricholoma matsutake]|nr:hypothetical protein L208DRAFT_1384902 [Tricholoma matsutake 945]
MSRLSQEDQSWDCHDPEHAQNTLELSKLLKYYSKLIQCYFRLTSSMDAISCQDGLQINFSSLYKSHRSVRGNIGIKFHS